MVEALQEGTSKSKSIRNHAITIAATAAIAFGSMYLYNRHSAVLRTAPSQTESKIEAPAAAPVQKKAQDSNVDVAKLEAVFDQKLAESNQKLETAVNGLKEALKDSIISSQATALAAAKQQQPTAPPVINNIIPATSGSQNYAPYPQQATTPNVVVVSSGQNYAYQQRYVQAGLVWDGFEWVQTAPYNNGYYNNGYYNNGYCGPGFVAPVEIIGGFRGGWGGGRGQDHRFNGGNRNWGGNQNGGVHLRTDSAPRGTSNNTRRK